MSAIVPATLTTWFEYAEELLTVCSDAIAETDAGEIERRYVYWDRPMLIPGCDQLIVSGFNVGHSNTITLPSGAGVRDITGAVNLVGFLVTIARACAPTFSGAGSPPEPADLEAASKEMFDSVFAVWSGVYNAKRAGTLFEGKARELFFDGGQSQETQGTLMRAEIQFRAEIYGIIASGP